MASCACSESYDRIEEWEEVDYIVPKMPDSAFNDSGCKCTPRSANPSNPFAPNCDVSNDGVSNPGTYTQDPVAGEKVVVEEAAVKSKSNSPEPKCTGNCSSSPGQVETTDVEYKNLDKKTITITAKVKGRKIKCKWTNGTNCKTPEGTPHQPQQWEYECPEYEVKADVEVTPVLKKWKQITPITVDCKST